MDVSGPHSANTDPTLVPSGADGPSGRNRGRWLGLLGLGTLTQIGAAVGVLLTDYPLIYLGSAVVSAVVVIVAARRVINNVMPADPVFFIGGPWSITVGVDQMAAADFRLGVMLIVGGTFMALIGVARVLDNHRPFDVAFIVVGLWLGGGAALAVYQRQWAATLVLPLAAAIVVIAVVRLYRSRRQ